MNAIKPVVAAILVTCSLNAQPAPSEVKRPPAARQAQEARPGTPQVAPLVRNQALTEEQREKLRSISESTRAEQVEARRQVQAARAELERAIRAEEIDEKGIREKAAALGKAEGELAVLRARQSKAYREAGLSTAPPRGLPSRPDHSDPSAAAQPRFQQRLNSVVKRQTNAPGVTVPAKKGEEARP